MLRRQMINRDRVLRDGTSLCRAGVGHGGDALQRGITIFVVFLIIGPIGAVANPRNPIRIATIPCDGSRKAFVEGNERPPAEFCSDLPRVESVSMIVSRPVGYILDERFWFVHDAEGLLNQVDIFQDVCATDVVNLACAAALEDCKNSSTAILDVQSIAFLSAVTING